MIKLDILVKDCQMCEGTLVYVGENYGGGDPNTGKLLDVYECNKCNEIYYIPKNKEDA